MVYICIPAYNEERTIGVVLWKIRQVMSEFERDYEVLVVDDGSSDGTGAVMEPYARIMPLHVRRHARREGYAPSLEALLREAVERSPYPKRDVAVTIQADFTDEPEDIATLVKRIEGGADVVSGRVRLEPAETPLVMRWSRRIWSQVVRRLRGGRLQGDALSGFRAYRIVTLRKAIDAAGADRLLNRDGWAANAQLLQRVAPHSRRTESVDVALRYQRLQRDSRFQPFRASVELFNLLRGAATPAMAPVGPAAAPAPAEAAGGAGVGTAPAPGDSGGAARGPRRRGGRRRGRGRGGRGQGGNRGGGRSDGGSGGDSGGGGA